MKRKHASTILDMVQKIKKVFGLNNVQVAQVVGISRPTLYNHLNGKEDPISIENYKEIHNIACFVEKEIGCDLKRGLKSVLVEGKTLLGYLKEETIDQEQILKVAQQIKNKLDNTPALNSNLNIKNQIRTSRAISRAG